MPEPLIAVLASHLNLGYGGSYRLREIRNYLTFTADVDVDKMNTPWTAHLYLSRIR